MNESEDYSASFDEFMHSIEDNLHKMIRLTNEAPKNAYVYQLYCLL